MNRPTIAVDIDEVLAAQAPAFVEYSNRVLGMSLTIDDYHEHWAELWKTGHEQMRDMAHTYNASGVLDTLAAIPDAKEALTELSGRFNLIIVTARRKDLAAATEAWIMQHYANIFNGIHYAGIWDTNDPAAATFTKADICVQLGAQYLIDDQVKHCNGAQDAGVQALLFGGYAWNSNEPLSTGVVRCADWRAVLEYFDGNDA